ncbi:HicA-like toxin of HicAB toxin-antitoxin system [Sulfurirhabdus autotrophica]|uniref:HicA-like toxin of HicAB toxin-antitoxin system n=2 Tax=Sulfurirhabdus autotrophica TaxID=1706046 RepID=A0A4R3Y8Z6_9PROT|nr:HicA-like toxin of HicAB toxin-antitoxin system [Sulfurirhabdus autotrophica]
MIEATGAKKSEGAGSRVRFLLNGVPGMFHRPHPQKETDKGAVESVRKFLIDAGIEP